MVGLEPESVGVVSLQVSTLKCKYSLDFFGFFEFMLSWFSEFFEGKSLFSRYLRVIGRCTTLLGRISTYFELGTRSWGRAMSKKPFFVNEYLHNEYLHLSVFFLNY